MRWSECDTLVIAGSSFPYLEFYPKPGQAKTIQIEIDATRIGLRHPGRRRPGRRLRARCSARSSRSITRKTDRAFLDTAQERMKQWNKLMELRGTRQDLPMKPQVVAHALNEFLDDDAIVSADSGTIATWAARHIRMRGDDAVLAVRQRWRRWRTDCRTASARPSPIPGRQVVAIVGDGGFTMLMGEVATLVKYKLPVKVIIFKNNVLGMIKWEQMVLEGTPQFGVELQPIDFAAFARACGAGGFTVDDPTELPSVLRQAFDHPGPAVVEAVVDPNEPPLPGKITTKQAVNFAEALLKGEKDRWDIVKTVLKDTAREIV